VVARTTSSRVLGTWRTTTSASPMLVASRDEELEAAARTVYAVHEAGHAAVAYLLGMDVLEVSIGPTGGRVYHGSPIGCRWLSPEGHLYRGWPNAHRLMVAVAGEQALALLVGREPGLPWPWTRGLLSGPCSRHDPAGSFSAPTQRRPSASP